MKTTQITEEIDSMDAVVFEKDSEIVQVGFTTDKKTLLQISKATECMYDEATFTISEEGLSHRSMDPSHVALIDMGIPNACFEKWSCIEEQKFALNIEEFRKLVNSLDAKGSISVVIKDEKIFVTQNGFTANVKTLEPSANDCPLPRIPYDNEITFSENEEIHTPDFAQLTRKIATVSDYVTIVCDAGKVLFSGKGDNGECSKQFTSYQVKINNREDSDATYSLEYILPYMRTLSKDSEILIGYSSQKPMRIQTKINNLGRIDFYLAPRVEN